MFTQIAGKRTHVVLRHSLFHHEFVNHSRKEYAKGEAHVNRCEGEFALFKSFILIHRGVVKYNSPLF